MSKRVAKATASALLDGALVVVETEDAAYIGRLFAAPDGRIQVRTGRQGHPTLLWLDDIEAVVPAEQHPDVVFG